MAADPLITNYADLDAHTPTIVAGANKALGYLGEYLNMGKTVRRDFVEDDFAVKGRVLNIPKRGTLSANDKGTQEDVTNQALSDTYATVTLDTHKEVTFTVEDTAKLFAVPGAIDGYMQDAAMQIAEEIEDDLAALYASAGTTQAYATSWESSLAVARRTLVLQKIPRLSPFYFQADPYAYAEMLQEDLFEDASKAGTNAALMGGIIRQARGFSVFESQVVGIDTSTSPDTYYCIAYGPDAMVLAVRPLPMDGNGKGAIQQTVSDPRIGLSMRTTLSYDTGKLGLKFTVDCLYGVAVLRSEHLIAISHQPAVNV